MCFYRIPTFFYNKQKYRFKGNIRQFTHVDLQKKLLNCQNVSIKLYLCNWIVIQTMFLLFENMQDMNIQSIKIKYDIIGNSSELNHAIEMAVKAAPTDMSVLIMGESGVGKENFSRIIHDNSERGKSSRNKLIAVNCGAIPEGTIESELFGHKKGSFTSADTDRKGYFEVANGGTIFLDEIGELPMSMQAKLLRVLENGEIIPVGSSIPQKVDVRIVSATNVDIDQAVRNGKFRQDLYYRLCQISIKVPALRERKEDIPLLFRKFAADVADRQHTDPIRLTDDAKEYLINYPWYGNIRELKHFAESISVLEYERTVDREILRKYLNYNDSGNMPAVYKSSDGSNEMTDRELLLRVLSMGNMIHELHNEINDLKTTISDLVRGGVPVGHVTQAVANSPAEQLPPIIHHNDDIAVHYIDNGDSTEDFVDTEVIEEEPLALEEREKRAIIKALEKHHGNRKPAAADLNISERTLYRKLKKYGIE